MSTRDPFTVAVVLATGLVVWAIPAVGVVIARTIGHHHKKRNRARTQP